MLSKRFAIAVIGVSLTAAATSFVFVKSRSSEQVSFLEKAALKLERTKALAPETRDHIVRIVNSHQTPHQDQGLEGRRVRALSRIEAALQTKPHGQIASVEGPLF